MEKRELGQKVRSLVNYSISSSHTQWLSGLYYADFISVVQPYSTMRRGRQSKITEATGLLSHSLFLMHVGGAKKAQIGAIGLQGDLDGKPLVSLCHLIGLFG